MQEKKRPEPLPGPPAKPEEEKPRISTHVTSLFPVNPPVVTDNERESYERFFDEMARIFTVGRCREDN